jgi:hypothetical protein
MKVIVSSLALLLFALAAHPAEAQVVAGPPGSSGGLLGGHRPVDPNRTSQRLSLNVDLSAGYDTNAEGVGSQGQLVPFFASSADSVLRYWRGKSTRFIEASARSYVNYESTARDQLLGGEALLTGSSNIGSKFGLTGGALVMLEPNYLAGQFDADFGESEPTIAPPRTTFQGLQQQRWVAEAGYLSFAQAWSTRQATDLEIRAQHRRPIDGAGLESQTEELFLTHNWNLRPSAGVQASYRFENSTQTDEIAGALPTLRTQTVNFGLNLSKRYSSVRMTRFNLNGGAAFGTRDRRDAVTDELSKRHFVLPVASGSFRMGLTRVWTVAIEGEREVSVLEGIAPESFLTTTGSMLIEAMFSRRVIFGISGIYTDGEGTETASGSFQTASLRSQIQLGFSACCGMFASYGYYNHNVRDISRLPVGYPPQYHGHAVRLGFTWWLPLYGSF